jgi:hypothetical protein
MNGCYANSNGSGARNASSIAAWRGCAAIGRGMEKPASAI